MFTEITPSKWTWRVCTFTSCMIHLNSHKYRLFEFLSKVYQFKVLPFGLNTVLQVVTLHHLGISVLSYIDGWLVHLETLLNHQSVLLKMLILVGLKLNVKKLQLTPVHNIQFLGSEFTQT